MPITINTSRQQLLSNTQAVTSSTGETKQNHHAVSDDTQPTLNQPSPHNTYGASMIGINAARAQWSMQDNLKPPTEVKLNELNFTVGECFGDGGQARVHTLVDQYAREFAGKFFFEPKNLEKEYKNYTNIGTHPNIVQCYGKKEEDGKEYLVMEKIDGNMLKDFTQNLDNYCRIVPKDMGQYAPALRLMLTEQLMDGLNFLGEKGISHADLKPDNILLSKEGQLKLIDFGLSMKHQESPVDAGTIHYQAPETFVDEHAGSSKIDGYAAGNIALELLTGCYLRQKGSLSHVSENRVGQGIEKFAAGMNFMMGKEPLNDFPLSASGSFFPTENKEGINHKNGEAKQVHPDFPESFEQPNHTSIHPQLEEKVIRALLCIHPKNRADIKVVHQTIKQMADEYLTPEVRAKSISLLQKMNHSPCKDFMQAERETANLSITGGRNYANEKVAHAEGGMVHYPDKDEIAETRSQVLPNKDGIVYFNPDKKICSVVLGAVPPHRKKSMQSGVSTQSTLEKERLKLGELELNKLALQQQLDRRKLEQLLQEQQKNKSLAQPAPPSVANEQETSLKTPIANKKKTPLLAD